MYIPFWAEVHHQGDARYWQILTDAEATSQTFFKKNVEQLLEHEEWFFKTIAAIIATIDHGAYPATLSDLMFRIYESEQTKAMLNDCIYQLLVLRFWYRSQKKYKEGDVIRSRLGQLRIEVQDQDHKDGSTLLCPVWGKFQHWEYPPFSVNGFWHHESDAEGV